MIEILDKGFNIWTLVIVQQIDIDVNLIFLPFMLLVEIGDIGGLGVFVG